MNRTYRSSKKRVSEPLYELAFRRFRRSYGDMDSIFVHVKGSNGCADRADKVMKKISENFPKPRSETWAPTPRATTS